MSSQPFSVPVEFVEANHDLQNIWIDYGESSRRILPKGWTKDPGRRAMSVDVVWEKDVRITLRDGVKLLADVFRPLTSDSTPVPALMPWSPYGKTGAGPLSLDMFPWRMGIPRGDTSGLEKWEAPDPADWCARGYAVVNIDARGAYKSEGDCAVYGTQEGRDGYDSIEWIAEQKWCTGSVAMVGNSWLATTQWFIAAEKPPHLTCMAPWEGLGDYYRESICRGGIPDYAFWDVVFSLSGGMNKREDVSTMVQKYNMMNDYWEDKKPKLRNIDVPMYVTASYSTGLHTEGSLRGFLLSKSEKKWLRWTGTQEWHDLYQPENVDDLQLFLDRHMLGKDNEWDKTPRVRVSLLGYNQPSVFNRPVPSYPPPDFKYLSYYLDANESKLVTTAPASEARAEYDAASKDHEGSHFSFKFDKYTELCGFSKVKLYMSTPDHDDMDVYAVIRKLDSEGRVLQHLNISYESLPPGTKEDEFPVENMWRYIGPNGRLRASHRAVSSEHLAELSEGRWRELMGDAYVWHAHDKKEPLKPDEVVELEFHLWPGGMIFHSGESMRLEIMGRRPIIEEFVGLDKNTPNENVGKHVIHTGGKYKSELVVPLSSG